MFRYTARQRILGPEHTQTLESGNNLGGLLHLVNRLAESIAIHRELYGIRRRVLGEQHPHTAMSLSNIHTLERAISRDTVRRMREHPGAPPAPASQFASEVAEVLRQHHAAALP